MSAMFALILTLFILMILVGGKQGISSFMALALNTLVILISVVLMSGGFSPLIIALIAGGLILATTIFMGTGESEVAGVAFISSLFVMALLAVVILMSLRYSATGGFGTEDGEDLEGMGTAISVSMVQIGAAAGLLGTLGAIAEAATAVAAGTFELDTRRDHAGILQMGREIIGTALNTLFFGFFGGFCGLFIWFVQLHYSMMVILNNKIFVSELLDVLFSVIAVILTVPVTIFVASKRWDSRRKEG
ncbi:YibE/F family protein [Lacticaseibacillus pabuli]|uniref:YibE/F family protein n=1 Tax=Lacticaseibacillus pabuli TaxID=3025672 RepID=A0ABY7WWU3_9LACO|nr:YibE/F family protein [Lacticaseibacillus sp. KACC 23028]WDF83422.1 YibE/F family protein [Lacticaseibacillus sp. KACC 23028]